ncbi:MAG: VWA domain-containing protein [Gammaproteobacteria bacterium]|nr:VWA domain-containing protein [Gammaproteobacteria bacterium]
MMHFAWPWVWLLLPLPWLLRYILPRAETASPAALRVPFFARLQQLGTQHERRVSTSQLRRWLAYLVWILVVCAAARPQWLGQPIELPLSGRDLMLAVDLSGSMQTQDMTLDGRQVDRLTMIKSVAGKFIAQRTGDRIGLILFGTHAYLQTPLTYDRTTVRTMLDEAAIGMAGKATAIGDAIGLAVKRLRNYPNQSRVLILLTDGANDAGEVTPLQAAKLAAQEHIRIYTIGVGAERMLVQGFFGNQVAVNPSQDLDVDALRKIAKATGGRFFRAKNTDQLREIYHELDRLEPTVTNSATFRPFRELYPWPLGLALLLGLGFAWLQLPARIRTADTSASHRQQTRESLT